MTFPVSTKATTIQHENLLKRKRTDEEERLTKSAKKTLDSSPSGKKKIHSIPTEVWSKIIVFLNIKELATARQVNSLFKEKIEGNFWATKEFVFPVACFADVWISHELSKQKILSEIETKQAAVYAKQPDRSRKGASKQKKLLPFLKKAELISPSGASDESIKALAKEANLEKVDLSYNELITDKGVIALATLSSNLRSLSLLFCANITDKSILHLVRSCPRLESLDITFTNTTEDLHERLRREYPLLKFNAF